MKTVLKFIFLLTTLTNVSAQSAHISSANLLKESRFLFNKKLIKQEVNIIQQLPHPEYLFKQSEESEIEIEGLIFVTDNNTITGIKGIEISAESLKQINDRLEPLDKLQRAYSEASNDEYQSDQRNNHEIVFNDRKFFATLRAVRSTARDIKKIYASALPAAAKSEAIAKLKFANVDWQFYKQILDIENAQMSANNQK